MPSHVKSSLFFSLRLSFSSTKSAFGDLFDVVEQRSVLKFARGMIFSLLKRIECYKRPLVTRLCHKKMFTSRTEILKKAENIKTPTKLRKCSLEIVD